MIKQKDLLVVLWMTFITVAAWIGFNVYHVMVTSTIDEDLQMQIAPIDPVFDTASIDKLKNRQRVEPLYQYGESNDEKIASKGGETIPTEPVLSPEETGSGSAEAEPAGEAL